MSEETKDLVENQEVQSKDLVENQEVQSKDLVENQEVHSANSHFQWYAIQSYAGQEKQARKLLLNELCLHKMEHLVGEIFIPEEKVTTKVRGKERKQLISYYPGYILVQMNFTEDLWHVFQHTSKISGFIGKFEGNKPIVVPKEEIEVIKQQIKDGTKQSSINSSYQIGQNVRIIEGAFNDFVGYIEQINTEKNSLVVSVNIFGRSVPVELNFDKVKIND